MTRFAVKEEIIPPGANAATMSPTTTTEVPVVIVDKDNACWACKKHPITYQPDSCNCAIYCEKCAMKMATGGICKKCKHMYGGMRRMS